MAAPVVEDGLVGEVHHALGPQVLDGPVQEGHGVAARPELDPLDFKTAPGGELLGSARDDATYDLVALRSYVFQSGLYDGRIMFPVNYDEISNGYAPWQKWLETGAPGNPRPEDKPRKGPGNVRKKQDYPSRAHDRGARGP